MGRIDRRRRDADVIERVLGRDDSAPYSEVIEVGIRPWLGGMVTSAVQVSVGDDASVRGAERADAETPRRDKRGAPGGAA